VHWHAAQLGSRMPGGRMDPPLLMALDEIVQVCPVPLDIWAADSGGKGIQLVSVAHGEAQLAGRWGEHGKQVILDTASAKIILPGVTDPDTLDTAARLAGQVPYRERHGDAETRHDVLTADMIRRLPPGFGLIIRGGNSPVIAKLARGWREPDYRRARRHGRAIADLTPAAAPLTLADTAPAGHPAAAAAERPLAPVAWLQPRRAADADAADGLDPDGAPDGGKVPVGPAPSYPWGGDRS
ncbi:MAG TPA: TraM recognition domain-containing protein, partial [Streptosporangiaceae bacterium]|nr:TraM recognition domain-containing protein [Streptosporangiaceae bacterium]